MSEFTSAFGIDAMAHFARNGRTFHFASRLMPGDERARVGDVYSYCRLTDDLVDEAGDASDEELYSRLDQWLALSRSSYDGDLTGIDIVDRAMTDMRARGVPFRYADDLIAGMRMDIRPPEFQDLIHLSTYTYRVAGVVGLWLSRLFGVTDPWALDRAATLGHAMQLTNIVRDVGDDWRRGRVYLPVSLLRSYGITRDELGAMYDGTRSITPGFRAAMETLMTIADAHYLRAFEAMPILPPAFRRSVAVAAEVYRGIHDEVRRNGYDTIRLRAHTTLPRKVALGSRGLGRLRAATRNTHSFLPPHAAHGLP
ncbi:MAG: phytoene/squalene synthase family protein [Gemmatimonadaceae bacterium]